MLEHTPTTSLQRRAGSPAGEARARRVAVGTVALGLLLGAALAVPAMAVLAASQPPSGEQLTSPAGDAAVGKNLFMGTARFQNGGPPCMACHSVGGIGALGGGALGPDLTGAYAKLKDAAVTWPETVQPMRAIFAEKPLTADEKDHLLMFLQSASVSERPTEAVGQLAGLAVLGTAVLLGLAHLTWRHRLHQVRRPMVSRSALPRS